MVGITYVYIDMVFRFNGYFNIHLYCLVGCLSMIVWTHAVLGVLYACVLYLCVFTCSLQFSMFHMERHSRNTLIKSYDFCAEVGWFCKIDNAFLFANCCYIR